MDCAKVGRLKDWCVAGARLVDPLRVAFKRGRALRLAFLEQTVRESNEVEQRRRMLRHCWARVHRFSSDELFFLLGD